MNVSTKPAVLRPAVNQQALPAQQAQQEPVVVVQDGDSGANDTVSWGDAGLGLVSAGIGGAIQTVGMTASSVGHTLVGGVEAGAALWKAETIGPVLKTVGAALLPLAMIATPPLVAVASLGHGLFTGFTEGIKTGPKGATKQAVENVKDLHKDGFPDVREGIREFGNEKLEEGEEAFDVSIKGGAEGIAAGVANGALGAVGFGAATIRHLPSAFVNVNKAISASDMGAPLKTVSHIMTAPLAVVAAPLGLLGGALFGLVSGAYNGYNDGLGESLEKTGDYLKTYNKYAGDALEDLGNVSDS